MPSILITGTNRGIGLELAKHYANKNWQVHACCRSPASATELQDAANQHTNLHLHELDTNNNEQRQSLADKLAQVPIDILFNNAGVYGNWNYQRFGKTQADEWLNAFQTNVIATMKMMEQFATHVARSEKRIIVNMSSKMGSMDDNGSGGSYIYRSCKAAVNAITMSAARDLSTHDITVIAQHPGWVRTDMGGPHGEITATTCAKNINDILEQLSIADSGRFIDIDGSTIPW
jgi:NAD(P)-dependent dehydrogenase (short-subunit alcohol dehydrogenase family)